MSKQEVFESLIGALLAAIILVIPVMLVWGVVALFGAKALILLLGGALLGGFIAYFGIMVWFMRQSYF